MSDASRCRPVFTGKCSTAGSNCRRIATVGAGPRWMGTVASTCICRLQGTVRPGCYRVPAERMRATFLAVRSGPSNRSRITVLFAILRGLMDCVAGPGPLSAQSDSPRGFGRRIRLAVPRNRVLALQRKPAEAAVAQELGNGLSRPLRRAPTSLVTAQDRAPVLESACPERFSGSAEHLEPRPPRLIARRLVRK